MERPPPGPPLGRSPRTRSRKHTSSASWVTPRRRWKPISLNAFREGLREAGYEEGRNITIKYLWADGQYDRFPTLVSELVAAKVDVIVTAGTPAALAVKQNPTNIPLVMVAVGDPVGTGLVENLAHPGGKLTGLSSIAPDLEGKRLQLLREVAPGLSHVVMLINSLNPFHIASVRQALAAAQTLGIRLQQLDVHKSDDIDGVLAALRKDRPDGLFILADRVFLHNRQRIADFASNNGCRASMPTRSSSKPEA